MTPVGRKHLIERINGCETLEQLATLWGNMAFAYQRDEQVAAAKEARKATLGAALTNQGAG